VLAHLGVDEEAHRRARGRQVGEGLERDLDRVADPAHVDHQALGALLRERAGEGGDHAPASAPSARATRRASGAWWRWQRARASASAASGAGGRARPRRSATPRPMARLSASPWPTVASFTLAGAYSASAVPAAPAAASTAPRASPRRNALCTFRATK